MSISVLQALYSLVSMHEAIAEIKDLIFTTGIRDHMHWIRAYVRHSYYERAEDALVKSASTR